MIMTIASLKGGSSSVLIRTRGCRSHCKVGNVTLEIHAGAMIIGCNVGENHLRLSFVNNETMLVPGRIDMAKCSNYSC